MTEKGQKTLLPFATRSEEKSEEFTNGTEKAAIFCLSEMKREDGGGIFNRQPSEKINFISKTYYPFWVSPFKEYTILFDGLNVESNNLTYSTIPDPTAFTENLKQQSSTRQIYTSFLNNNVNYFEKTNGEQTYVVEGLISDKEFLKEFLDYLKEAIVTSNSLANSVLISPASDESRINSILKDLENSRSKIKQELKNLNESIKAVNAKSQQFLNVLRDEIKNTEEKYFGQISAARKAQEEKKSEINKEYTRKVTEASSSFERDIVSIHKEVIKLEKTRDELNSEIDKVENEIKTATVNKDDEAEQKWKEKRNELKKKIPDLNSEIENLQLGIQEIEEKKKKELFELKEENDEKLKEAGNELRETESSRDAEIKILQNEMEKIEELTSVITSKIDKLTKIREANLTDFQNLGIQQERATNLLVRMPFYLLSYQSKENKRYSYFPPCFVNSLTLSARLKAVGKKKISQIFQPRSEKITSILNKFMDL